MKSCAEPFHPSRNSQWFVFSISLIFSCVNIGIACPLIFWCFFGILWLRFGARKNHNNKMSLTSGKKVWTSRRVSWIISGSVCPFHQDGYPGLQSRGWHPLVCPRLAAQNIEFRMGKTSVFARKHPGTGLVLFFMCLLMFGERTDRPKHCQR